MMQLWSGQFGNDYTARNTNLDLDIRSQIWGSVIPAECRSILEVGANIGTNLQAISSIWNGEMYACEPNKQARAKLRDTRLMFSSHISDDTADKLTFKTDIADLVFTCGVLIHIPPDKLLPSMREIHRCAGRWIISAEYFAPQEEMIPYRGQLNALWRRDYGSIWLDNFPDLHAVSCLFTWKRMTGLDNLTFWLLEKGPMRH